MKKGDLGDFNWLAMNLYGVSSAWNKRPQFDERKDTQDFGTWWSPGPYPVSKGVKDGPDWLKPGQLWERLSGEGHVGGTIRYWMGYEWRLVEENGKEMKA